MNLTTEFTRVLDALEEVRAKTAGDGELKLPQVCVVGDQSSGKSTLLGTTVPGLDQVLPQGTGTCTVAPIVVNTRRAKDGTPSSITVGDATFAWDANGRAQAQGKIKELQQTSDFCRKMGSDANDDDDDQQLEGEDQQDILKREISVRVVHPDATDLTVVDLPGLVETGPGRVRVERMVRKYIAQPNCLIVVVQVANADLETTKAARMAAEADPQAARTLLVLTKADSFSENANKTRVAQLVRSGQGQARGPHVVCCRKKTDGDDVATAWTGATELQFFHNDKDFAPLITWDRTASRRSVCPRCWPSSSRSTCPTCTTRSRRV